METKRPRDGELAALRAVSAVSGLALEASHEDDFLRGAAAALREYAGADAVLVRIWERRIETRAVAAEEGVHLLSPGELSAPLAPEDVRFWLAQAEGYYCGDVTASPAVRREFRDHLLSLGLRSAFVVPMIRSGDVLGQIVFAWKSAREPDARWKAALRQLTAYTATQFSLLHWKHGNERDPMTGLLNWYGLRRRWERLAGARRGAVLFVEVGNFRSVVEARGRLAGDDLLRETARLVQDAAFSAHADASGAADGPGAAPSGGAWAHAPAVVGRLSVDAFVALIPDVSLDDAAALAAHITRRFDAAVERRRLSSPYLTIGLAAWPRNGRELQALVSEAERSACQRKRRRVELTMTTQLDPGQGRLPRTFLHGWLASSGDGVVLTDGDLKVIYVNPAYERMSGYTLKQWLGKSPGFIASGKTPLRVYEDMWNSLSRRGTWTGQVVNRRPDGEEWVSHLTITRILDRRGRPVGFLGVARSADDVKKTAMSSASVSAFEDAITKESLIMALAKAAKMHGGDSLQHLERVRWFTHLLVAAAAEEGMEEFQSYEFRSAVTMASVLHDIGKLSLPRELLQKPGRLEPHEFELMKTHTVAGREMLSAPFLRGQPAVHGSYFLEVAADIAGSHHEKWDGSGYPEGLAGTQIPMAARVVAVADVYDALRSERPYRRAWSHTEAVEYIESHAGKHFDPRLVELFLSIRDAFDQVYRKLPDRYRTVIA